MNFAKTIDVPAAPPSTKGAARKLKVPDDMAMMRAAKELTSDIAEARAAVYWTDLLLSAGLGYAALAGAILLGSPLLAVAAGVIAVLLLYRAMLFIHELTHIHRNALPGFRTTWNLLVGIPMLTPSFMYEGVHTLHHARTRYGTSEDPEYLPLALMKWWSLPSFILISLLAPPALLIRFAVLNPIGLVIPAVRKLVWERFSALAINPDFRRRPPEGALRG
ncbi:MAG TPA: fatty acid desaturase, partial [Croceibacterium sp.]|nr:fatty acid desaturase [Croceibacterium sp.]